MLAYSLWLPLSSLYLVVARAPGAAHVIPAAAATVCYLPVVFWLVRSAVQGSRPRAAGWVLAALAAGVLATLPVIGLGWLSILEPLAGLALIIIRWPWSLPAFAAIAAAPAPLAFALGHPDLATVSILNTVIAGALIAAPVWLIGAVRHLHAARGELSHAAVIGERLRIDGELRQTLGAAMAVIITAGDRASRLAAADSAAAGADLRALASESRAALAESRRLARRYRQVSLRSELQTAATLLSAAGIGTRIVMPPSGVPDVISAELRSQLRSELARLLRDDSQRQCVIAVTRHHGQVCLELLPDNEPPGRVMSR